MEYIHKNRLEQVMEYLNEHPNIFNNFEREAIKRYALKFNDREFLPDVIREVYDELGLIKKENNIYVGFIQMLDDAFNVSNKRILEVGGGVIPRIGKRISLMQDKGDITVYDPRLSCYEESTDKMKLIREKFTREMDVSKFDLMIGFMPCSAADMIVDSAVNNNKDFMIALCEGGPHGDEFDFFEDEFEWRNSLISCATRDVRDAGMGKLKVKYMDRYNNPYPVIYNQRNK